MQTQPAHTIKSYTYITTEKGLTMGAPKDLSTEEDKNRLAHLQRRFRLYSMDLTGNNICLMCKVIQQCYVVQHGFPASLPQLSWEFKCFSSLAGMDPSMAA